MDVQQLKTILLKIINTLLAVCKVIAMTGGAVFSVKKFMELLTNAKDGLESTEGKSAAGIAAFATAMTTILVRYFSMVRKAPVRNNEVLVLTNPQKAISVITRFSAGIYAGYSGLSGYLGAFTLMALLQKLWEEMSHTHSDKESDAIQNIILFNIFYTLVGLSNSVSFKKYNYECLHNYLHDFNKGKWKEYHWPVFALTGANVVVQAALANLSNRHVAELLNERILLKISSHLYIPRQGAIIFSLIGVGSGIITNSFMSIAAMARLWDKFKTHPLHENLSQYADTLPKWYKARYLAFATFFIDSLQSGVGTTAAFAYALKEYAKLDPHDYRVIIVAFIPAILATINAFALNQEGYRRELEDRYKIINEKNAYQTLPEENTIHPDLNDEKNTELEIDIPENQTKISFLSRYSFLNKSKDLPLDEAQSQSAKRFCLVS